MPTISQNKSGGRITWDKDDWISGLHPNYSAAVSDVPVPVGNGQLTFASKMNPYRFFGYASPGFNPADVTNVSSVTDSAIRHIVIAYDNTSGATGYFGYGINTSSKLFQISTSNGAITSQAGPPAWPHTITSASGAVEGNDVCAYSAVTSSAQGNKVFYSYNNNGATVGNPLWNVGMYNLNGTFDDDFMTTVPATPLSNNSPGGSPTLTYPHPLIVGDDDVLYIADGNKIHAFDGAQGTDGKYIDSVLVLPYTFRITSFARYKQRLVIFGYKELYQFQSASPSSFTATEAKAYFWDYLANDPYDSVNLNDNCCSAAFEYAGTIGCFTQGRKPVAGSTQFAKLMLFNGSDFDAVTMIDNNIPVVGGVQVVGDTIMFNAGGQIYQYGSPYPGFPNALNKVAAGSGSTSGALITLATTMQVASTGTTTSGGLQTLNGNYNTGSFAPALAEPIYSTGMKGNAKAVTITFGKTASAGRDVSISFIGNDLTTTTVVQNVSTIDSSNIRVKYENAVGVTDLFRFTNVHPMIVWGNGSAAMDAPIIDKIELDYEEVNLDPVT